MLRSQREELQGLLAEAVTGLCRSSLKYSNKFSVEGLLGITVDDNEVLLVSLKETVNSGEVMSDNKPISGRTIAVAKKRTAKMAGLPSFVSSDHFPRHGPGDQHHSFTVTNSESDFSEFQTINVTHDAFESSSPNKKPCRSPSIGSAGSAPSPSFTPSATQEMTFPNLSQVPGNSSTPNPSNSQALGSAWSPDVHRLSSIASLQGGGGPSLAQERDGFGIRRKSIQKDRHFEHFWEDFEVIRTVCKFASENQSMKLGEMKDALQRNHSVGLDKSTSWFAHHLRKFVFNPLTSRLYVRVEGGSFGRMCVSEQELLELIVKHHSWLHEGPKKLYETLKEVYYPCNVKRFHDLYQQHVQPACSKCFLSSQSSQSASSSWHVLDVSRRLGEVPHGQDMKSKPNDNSASVAPPEATAQPINMVGRPSGILGNLSIMQI